MPLNGGELSASTLAQTLMLAAHRKLEVIVLHVHDEGSIPLFSDQRQHELESWADEFLRRHCLNPELVRLETRIGTPSENVLQVADDTSADLIALGWSQDLGPGRAAVIRAANAAPDAPLSAPAWERTAMAFGATVPGAAGHPLFSPIFAIATPSTCSRSSSLSRS